MSSHRSHYDAALDLWHGRPSALTEELNLAAAEHYAALLKDLEEGAAAGKILFFRKPKNAPPIPHG